MSGAVSSATAGQRPPGDLAALLALLHADRFTGAVVVSGNPGGSFHLNEGLVIGIRTPAAPTAETLLLKSRRLTEQDWAAARDESHRDGGMARALATRTDIGLAQLELTCVAAIFDAAFAMALSPAEAWHLIEVAQPPDLVVAPGIEPARLTEETARRTAVLAAHWRPVSRLTEARIRPSAMPASPLNERYRDILLAATGRRTPRDISFALGRGLYSVLLDLTRMHARKLIQWEAAAGPRPVPSVAARKAAPPPPGDQPDAPLPRRAAGPRTGGETAVPRQTLQPPARVHSLARLRGKQNTEQADENGPR